MKNLDFSHGHGRNFDHLTIVISKFWPWSWSKIFDHMTMTPARRPYGQKIMVALPPPPDLLLFALSRIYPFPVVVDDGRFLLKHQYPK